MNSWDGESSSFVRQLALCIATVSSSRYEVHMLKDLESGIFIQCTVLLDQGQARQIRMDAVR